MVLSVENLTVVSSQGKRTFPVVEDLSLSIGRGGTLALVGESGCGKTVSALSIMGLLPPGFSIASGSITLGGEKISSLPKSKLRGLRGRRMSMIFQEPMTALNPVMAIGKQVAEVLKSHRICPPGQIKGRVVDLLAEVGLPDPERQYWAYPHEFSGGMRQRVMCVMALAASPDLIIADEPTTALDATVQAQILDLLRDLQAKRGLAILLITHNLLAASLLADRVAVLYAGRKVEEGPTDEVLTNPLHPYARGLMDSQPKLTLGQGGTQGMARRLKIIAGQVPPPSQRQGGCHFHGRCEASTDKCQKEIPTLIARSGGHSVACFGAEEGGKA
ncbi:MAG: ABC transporter ATP-binding protein [Deltaproteobacteria bacterium]|jgi:oligopeptide/dipeptide ABC transporter ATP-binding protein|nr:ABC transporter ATP-binding protein [Deltaproteobacteria bacterium]